MEFEVISETSIKPSSPTPDHLKIHRFSLLDQAYVPSLYIPIILFYPMSQDMKNADPHPVNCERSLVLKQSLAETLTRFYPLAGKIRDDFSIDCNDEGAHYKEVRVCNSSLFEYLSQPDLEMWKFLPGEDSFAVPAPGSPVAMIKLTTFTCGGTAIGIFLSHTAGDGFSSSFFLKTWAAIARNSCNEITLPNFDAPSIFPQVDPFPNRARIHILFDRLRRKGKVAVRRFVFSAQSISNLKANKTCFGTSTKLTRVEAVSALLSKCIMAASRARSGADHKPTLILHAVNIRQRAVPPFPECAVGNYACVAPIVHEAEETELSVLVYKMKEALAKFDQDFVKNLEGDDGPQKLCEITSPGIVLSSEVDCISFSSWCNFGLYDIDFGWGRPFWVSCGGKTKSQKEYVNTVYLLDTRIGRGIEAWVSLGEEAMAMLEVNKDLLAHASIDPSPLISDMSI